MFESFVEWLEKRGAVTSEQGVVGFPDKSTQISALRTANASVVAPLMGGFSLLKVTGEEAEPFLQGQLSSDVRELDGTKAQYSSYSTAKGRMLANFLMWRYEGAFFLVVSANIAEAIAKRLKMFVLRAKVNISIEHDYTLLGVNGAPVQAFTESLPSGLNPLDMVVVQDNGFLIKLPGAGYLAALTRGVIDASLVDAMSGVTLVSGDVWRLRDIDAGIVWIEADTQELFVPQMANMDLIGAVSFKKGCYPGQEVVARTQYLGKVKRKLFRVALNEYVPNGSKLYSPDLPEQSIGALAAICEVDDGQFEGLAIIQESSWESGVFTDASFKKPVTKLNLIYLNHED